MEKKQIFPNWNDWRIKMNEIFLIKEQANIRTKIKNIIKKIYLYGNACLFLYLLRKEYIHNEHKFFI